MTKASTITSPTQVDQPQRRVVPPELAKQEACEMAECTTDHSQDERAYWCWSSPVAIDLRPSARAAGRRDDAGRVEVKLAQWVVEDPETYPEGLPDVTSELCVELHVNSYEPAVMTEDEARTVIALLTSQVDQVTAHRREMWRFNAEVREMGRYSR